MRYRQFLGRKVLWHGIALSLALLSILPLYWVMISSLRPVGLPPPRTVEWWPALAAWANYGTLFTTIPLGLQMTNSFLVSTLGAALTVLTASWAGLAMVQMPQRLQQWLVGFAVFLLMVPSTVVWLPRFILFSWMGIIDSYMALIAPALMGTKSLYVLMFYWRFRRLPLEYFESARLDGANALTIWHRIALPAALPTSLAVLLLTFSHYWSDFIDPLLYLKSQERYTVAVGLRMLQQMDVTNWSLLLAGVVVMMAPVILIYLVLQYFIRGEDRLR